MRHAAFLLCLLVSACGQDDTAALDPRGQADSLPSEADFLKQIDRNRGTRDCFIPIRNPHLVTASRAPRMRGEERVLGLDLGEVAIAYPVLLLNWFEIVEHEAAGEALLVCW